MKYDIFISYRRDGGEDKARLVNKKLKEMGYKVFFDHDAALRGQFETIIKSAIEISKVVVLVLSKECFHRCVYKEDFVRKELEYALKCGHSIIPILPKGDIDKYEDLFKVTNLPIGIASLVKTNCAIIDFHENFDSTFEYQIKKNLPEDVYPQNKTIDSENVGADIHVITDIPCVVYSYGRRIGTAQKKDGEYGSLIRLRKGRHKLRFESIDDEDITIDMDYTIPDNEYIDFIEVQLKKSRKEAIKKRIKIEEKQKQFILKQRQELQKSCNYLLTYNISNSRIVRQLSQTLQQIGNRSTIQNFNEIINSNELKNHFDILYGERIILTLLSEDYNLSEFKSIYKHINKDNNTIYCLVLLGNVLLPSEVIYKNIIRIDDIERSDGLIIMDIIEGLNKIANETKNNKDIYISTEISTKIATICEGLGFTMQLIRGGQYMMGDPSFNVDIKVNDFYMCRNTVTRAAWRKIMGDSVKGMHEDRPVVNMPIETIEEFIKKINQLSDFEFYIPTEEEWEWAARGGMNSRGFVYSGSNVLEEITWYKDNCKKMMFPRSAYGENGSTKHPNELGLLFMSGNVWEICQEYGSNMKSYVIRGGAFNSSADDCKVYSRAKIDLTQGSKYVGLRLAGRPK